MKLTFAILALVNFAAAALTGSLVNVTCGFAMVSMIAVANATAKNNAPKKAA